MTAWDRLPHMPVMLNERDSLDVLSAQVRKAGGATIVCAIPWAAIAPHEAQAERNHGQTLARLAARGGLGVCEAVAIMENRRWRRMEFGEAHARLAELIAKSPAESPAGAPPIGGKA